MSARYAPLPTAQSDHSLNNEMEAAFDDDDDEDDHTSESHPLNPSSPRSFLPARSPHARAPSSPAVYDFENYDYASVVPPGSPPRPSSSAVPNDYGNSNGLVPELDDSATLGPRRGWFRRTAAAVLPSSYVTRWGLDYERPPGAVGGGTNNDGVFANVTAKPSAPVQIRDGDSIYLVPEESAKDVPPSYASAQLDSVPPYWETTIHAPSPPDAFGEMIIDALPTGSLFSFLWNMLISISFQFVGFLLTYLLHTTHAARFGSRAGLGVTLIQYGFALRARDDSSGGFAWWGGYDSAPNQGQEGEGGMMPHMTFGTKEEAEEYYRALNITMVDGQPTGSPPATTPGATTDDLTYVNDVTTDWLSFFLMTIGWFILLTSLLGFWRVKRWERNIFASQQGPAQTEGDQRAIVSSLQRYFAPVRDMGGILRAGLGFGSRDDGHGSGGDAGVINNPHALREMLLAMYAHDPERQRQLIQAFRDDDELIESIRAAGML
ncbi:hypothetical protein OF83DRAFT_1049294 [Amylostereum chailletii]|nr:hypothetical protein OF83DRAFT_1049294 [Amylostereum chailletii]